MDVELAEIRDFLARHAPFDDLPAAALAELPGRMTVRYARRGTHVLEPDTDPDGLYVVRSGAVDLVDGTGELMERVGAGGAFGIAALMERVPTGYRAAATEDTLLLVLPRDEFSRLERQHPGFALFFAETHHARLRRAIGHLQQAATGSTAFRTAVRDLVTRAPVTTTPEADVAAAAATMSAAGVSSVLVLEDARLVGIVTDRDLRNRVLAAGRPASAPVREVMTPDPVTLDARALAFEALVEMVTRNIHHLPLVEDGRVLGLVTSTDLIRVEQSNPVYLVADVNREQTLEGVVEQAHRIPSVLARLVDQDATAEDIGRVVTALGDAVRRRVLALVEAELGPPPAPYAWVVLGSAAREEEGLSADQDHALVVADAGDGEGADPAQDPWFAELAERVTATLEQAGWPRCRGEVMATNPRWRMTVRQWQRQFSAWAREPEPEAVLHAAIFYDLRHLAGDPELTERVRAAVPATVTQRLVGHLAGQAVRVRQPLGFFRGLTLEHEGEHRDTLDLKRGISAIVQVARVLGLRAGSDALTTRDRIDAARDRGLLEPREAADLADALELLSYRRLHHQVEQVRAGLVPDNHVAPGRLTDRQRRHLKDAFGIVRAAQRHLAERLPPGYT